MALSLHAGASRAEAPSPAGTTEARARTLYDEASELLAQARVEEACRKLAESEALDPDVKTLQRLATCEEAEGKLARALAAYRQLTLLAGRSLRGARERAVLARVQRLEASVPRLIVRLSPEALGTVDLEVRACGVVLREGELGLPIPEDPGTCEVSARGRGKTTWTKSLDLGARGGRTEIVVPALEAEAPAPAAPTEALPAPPPAPPPEPPPPPPPTGPATERRITGVALVGLGLALAGTGAYFGVAAMGSSHDADTRCPTTTCADPDGLRLNDRALTQASLANLSLGAGAVAFVTGIAVLLTQPSRPAAGRSATRVWLRPAPGALGLGGVF
jgi:hypothetical protein